MKENTQMANKHMKICLKLLTNHLPTSIAKGKKKKKGRKLPTLHPRESAEKMTLQEGKNSPAALEKSWEFL